MILYDLAKQTFHLQTETLSYILRIYPTGHLGHVYFGARIEEPFNIEHLVPEYKIEVGNQVIYHEDDRTFNLNTSQMEISTYGKGDYRDPMIHMRFEDGSRLANFLYQSHEILEDKPHFPEMPEARSSTLEPIETLKVTLRDDVQHVEVDLYYSLFLDANVITRRAVVRNGDVQEILLEKVMSMNIDMPNDDYDLISLDGAWINERQLHEHPLKSGLIRIDSKKGVSSNDHNPFIAIKEKNTDENKGRCYGFSLIYSGNFEATAEVSPHNILRILMGIQSFDFFWPLKKQDLFVTPEVVLTYSHQGLSRMSQNFHAFVERHIIRPDWQHQERPVLINNWEATDFSFTERKLLKLARAARRLGIELFVLDDGWFGNRNDDSSSLGDWIVNKKKLPSGLEGFSQKIKRLGMKFGIWVEPEMVNPDSDLYRAHPEWIIRHPKIAPSCGRRQYVLDLSNPDVRDYLVNAISQVLGSAEISYCKWDMNRNLSDIYSPHLSHEQQGTLFHRYTLGLYDIVHRITSAFPEVLFESCASGGNRFDLGMLYYMPQVWTSDNTDAYARLKIQYGTSLVYPLSTMGAHVSNIPNMQTLRQTPIESRFNTAAFGLLGYELDLSRITPSEKRIIKEQIVFYKHHRHLFQYGRFYRHKSPHTSLDCVWMNVAKDQSEALLGVYQGLEQPNASVEKIPIFGLNPKSTYRVCVRKQYFLLSLFGDLVRHALPIRLKANGIAFHILTHRYRMPAETEEQVISGSALLENGFVPKQKFIGTGYNASVRLMGDFGSRIYHFSRIEDPDS